MPIELKKLVHVPSRTGRELQRYDMGRRQVVGCIPYRFTHKKLFSSVNDILEVLMVSSQKAKAMMFPKGGWEKDESSMEEAALRESLEEAGVIGSIQLGLGKWIYKSKTRDTFHDGYMFPLLVEEQLDYWPERDSRQRIWVTVNEAKELCSHMWMTEALELLVQRLDTKLESVPVSSNIIPQSNLVDGQISESLKFKLRKVESEVSWFTILSMKANGPPHDSAQAKLSPHNISLENEAANGEDFKWLKVDVSGGIRSQLKSVSRYSVLDSSVHRVKHSYTYYFSYAELLAQQRRCYL